MPLRTVRSGTLFYKGADVEDCDRSALICIAHKYGFAATTRMLGKITWQESFNYSRVAAEILICQAIKIYAISDNIARVEIVASQK